MSCYIISAKCSAVALICPSVSQGRKTSQNWWFMIWISVPVTHCLDYNSLMSVCLPKLPGFPSTNENHLVFIHLLFKLCLVFFLISSRTLSQARNFMTHLNDLDGLFNLVQLLGSLLDQMFEFWPLLPKISLCEQNQDIKEINTDAAFTPRKNAEGQREALISCIDTEDKSAREARTLDCIFRKVPHHLLLPLVVSGDDVVWLVGALGAGRADADVVGAAVDVQQTLVFLADLVLQVESRFNQSVGCHGLHLHRREDHHSFT